jgi:DNA-binding protein YbaB
MASYPWGPPSSSASSFTPPGAGATPKKGIDALAERYAGMKEEITAIRATASSPDRFVTVVAGPGGGVMDIQITEEALQGASARQLSSSLMSTLRIAVADGARQQAEIVQRYVGDRINVAERVMATQKEILGDKIEAGEQEEERLRAEHRSPSDDESLYVRSDPPSFQPQVQRSTRPAPTQTDDDDDYGRLYGSDE